MHWHQHLLGLKPVTSPVAVGPPLSGQKADELLKVFSGALHVCWPTGKESTVRRFISQGVRWACCFMSAVLCKPLSEAGPGQGGTGSGESSSGGSFSADWHLPNSSSCT